MIRTLVVDDEPLARSILIRALAAHADVSVVGEAGSGRAAIASIARLDPDLVFLDVQMPGTDGFGVMRALPPGANPAVIFVTAFDSHAVRAFEVSALDYLMKPVEEERLAAALARVRDRLGRPAPGEATRRLIELLEASRGSSWLDRLVVKTAGRALLLPVDEIDWLKAEGKLLHIRTPTGTHVMRQRLSTVAERLDPRHFLRISRSTVINLSRVREIRPWVRGEFAIIMTDGTRFTSTRSFRDGLADLFDHGS